MRFFQKIATLGTDYHENDVRPIVKAINVTAMLAVAISSLSALVFASINTPLVNIIQIIGVLSYLLPLYLNSKGNQLFAALSLGFSAAFQLTALPVLFFGPQVGIHYFSAASYYSEHHLFPTWRREEKYSCNPFWNCCSYLL